MSLEQRLKRWTTAGLLEEQQATRILQFERGHERPMFLYAVAGLGGLSIAIGLVSIVAANWDAIPGRIKIAIDLLLLLGGGLVTLRERQRWPYWVRDVATLVLYGLTMASIALVGQVYQLGGSARIAMTVWSLLTAPLMALGSTGLLAVVWLLGLETTYATWLTWLSERPIHQEGWALVGVGVVPWLLLIVGYSRWLRRSRPAYADVALAFGWVELIACASIGANAFYENTSREPWNALWIGMALSALMAFWLWRRVSARLGPKVAGGLLAAALLCMYVPARISPGDWDIVAALAFIGLWLVVALATHRAGMLHVLNAATAIIGVRIVIVYFEVFGSLLDTGLGLVTGGMLTLGIVWLWWRQRRGFQSRLEKKAERAS